MSAFIGTTVVIAGGSSTPPCGANASCSMPADPPLRDGAAFDSATGVWRTIAAAPTPVSGFNIAVVGNRMFVLTTNVSRADSPVTFLSYDTGSDRWATLPTPPDLDATLVAAGHTVVAIAGSDEHTRAVDAALDVTSRTWRTLPNDPLGPSFGRDAVWLGDRLLLVAGDLVPNPGSKKPVVNRMATLDRTLEHWSAPMPDSEVIGGGALFASGRVVWPDTGSSNGGGAWGRPHPHGGILDPSTGTWQALPQDVPNTIGPNTCELVVAGRVCVDGHLLNPVTLEWTRLSKLPGGQRVGSAMVAGPDTVWVWGGSTQDGSTQPSNRATGYVFRV